jgi:hypothetical protein
MCPSLLHVIVMASHAHGNSRLRKSPVIDTRDREPERRRDDGSSGEAEVIRGMRNGRMDLEMTVVDPKGNLLVQKVSY